MVVLKFCVQLVIGVALASFSSFAGAAPADSGPCFRPASASLIDDPVEVRSESGHLSVSLALHEERLDDGGKRYCYLTPDGKLSPTIRVRPGDDVVIRFRNDLPQIGTSRPDSSRAQSVDACAPRAMTPEATNLHFHGMTLPALCHADDVVDTLVRPGDPEFVYHFRIPEDEAPGLYWYHAHAHGLTADQVGGGASGAIIVDPANGVLAQAAQGLPQRVLVIRDQKLLNPNAPMPPMDRWIASRGRDSDGDAANSGLGFGKPSRDLSVNFVPIPYPDYPLARLEMRAGQRELWRIVNASAVTYLNLALLIKGVPQAFTVVGIDGVPLNWNLPASDGARTVDHLGLAPGARIEIVVAPPQRGETAQLVTRAVDTGRDGENDPNRPLVAVSALDRAPQGGSTPTTGRESGEVSHSSLPFIGEATPNRTRRFYFSEIAADPTRPEKGAQFFLTEEGHTPIAFDPSQREPNVEVRQGEVEDWVIENRTRELHVFHIHQLHFQVRDFFGIEVNEPFVRDTINVPFFETQMKAYPSVKLRMDFRGQSVQGTFVYHCHLLDHEDAGMMGTIRILPAQSKLGSVSTDWGEVGSWLRRALVSKTDSGGLGPALQICRAPVLTRPSRARDGREARRTELLWTQPQRKQFASDTGIWLPQP